MSRQASLLAVVSLVVGIMVVLPSEASADTSNAIPSGIGTLTSMAVDQAVGTVFIGGAGDLNNPGGGLVTTALDGSHATLHSIGNVTSLTVSPDGSTLYVAEHNDILALDASTLSVEHTWAPTSSGNPVCPQAMTFAGGNLWFIYYCLSGGTNELNSLGEIDLTSGVVTAGLDNNFGLTELVSVPGNANELFGSCENSYTKCMLSVSGTTVSIVASGNDGGDPIFALSPDGTRYFDEYHSTYADEFSTSTFAATGHEYLDQVGVFPTPMAYSPDGKFIALANRGDDVLSIIDYANGETVRNLPNPRPSQAISGVANVVDNIAWSGTNLYLTKQDGYGGTLTLQLITDAGTYPSSMSLSGPSTDPRNSALTLTGKLTGNSGAIAGNAVTITRQDLWGTHTLGTVNTSSSGTFTFHDAPNVGGADIYTATSTATTTQASAVASFTVQVSRISPDLKLSTNHSSYPFAAKVYATGLLTHTYQNHTLSIYQTGYSTEKTLVRTGTVSSSGYLTGSFETGENTTVELSYSGDAIYAPESVTSKITVQGRITNTVLGSYGTSDGVYLFHSSVKPELFVHVSASDMPNEHVVFYAWVNESGKWVSFGSPLTVATRTSDGGAGAYLTGASAGHEYLMEARFPGDVANTAVDGPYVYFKVTS